VVGEAGTLSAAAGEQEDVRPLNWPPVEFPHARFPVRRFCLAFLFLLSLLLAAYCVSGDHLAILLGLPVTVSVMVFYVYREMKSREKRLWADLEHRAQAGELEALFLWGLYLVQARIRAHHYALASYHSTGIPQVIPEAPRPELGMRWLLKAAEKNHAGAQCALGKCYADGVGIARDPAQAVQWMRLAAEQGLMEAQRNLARMYDDGIGLPKDAKEAIRWYRQAAAQGDENSRRDLVRLGVTGEPDSLAS
jgi:hypothetical protein